MKRSKLPWYSTPLRTGTQAVDEEAYPTRMMSHLELAELANSIRITQENYLRQAGLRSQIVDHKFKEYNHD